MAEVLLFHHAQGLTAGVRDFAARLGEAGHAVTVPDLYDGATFPTVTEGVAHAQQIGFDTVLQRGKRAAEGMPGDVVYIGVSLGVMPTQLLAQNRPRARAAVLIASCVPPAEFGGPWPDGVPVQIHGMDADAEFVAEGDLDAARALAAATDDAELFLYPGSSHLFIDSSLADYDADATALLLERVLGLLASVG